MRRMKSTFINFLTVILAFFSVLFLACPDNTEPEPTTCEYPPGNRTFTWRVDTVAWWPSFLGGVHAFSNDDAWVMGDMHGSVINGKNTSYMGLHWNGETWNETIGFLDILMKPNDVTGDNHFMVAAGYLAYGDNMGGTISKPALAEFDNRTKKWARYEFEPTGELRSVWTDGKGFFIAVGDNGMVYTKDGYKSEWVYSKAPTEFHFTNIVGVSKCEMYAISQLPTITGVIYQQYWKCYNNQWTKLYDGQDTTGMPVKLYGTDNSMYDLAVSRCSYNDSLKLYLIGWESFLLESEGQSLNYSITNLSQLGLPLRSMDRTAVRINLYSPNDYWIFGTRYNFYHWNGTDFQKIVMPGLPDDDAHFGDQHRMIKTSMGKIFLPTEVSSQVYVVVQGTP